MVRTNKNVLGTSTQTTTLVAELGRVMRLDFNKQNASHHTFILDKGLQLEETPVTKHAIDFLPSTVIPDSFKVFHNNLVTRKPVNDTFADVVVYPSHVTVFSSTQLLKKSIGASSAFGLEFITQMFKFPLGLFDFSRIIEPAVRADGEVVYSEVDAQNTILRMNVLLSGSDLFREHETKETPSSFIDFEEAFTNTPLIKVFLVTGRNVERHFNPFLCGGEAQDVVFETCATRKIILDGSVPYQWFGLGFFDHATCLFDTSNSELGLQSKAFKMLINEWLELDSILDFVLPSNSNTMLQSNLENSDGSNYFWGGRNLDFGSYIHSQTTRKGVYI